MDGLMQGRYLVHQLLVHGQAAGGIHDDYAVAFGLGFGHGSFGNLDRVFLPFFGVYGHFDALSQHLELLDGGGAEGIAGRQQDLHPAFGLDMEGQFAGESGFTGTVETGDQHDGGIPLEVDVLRLRAHESSQLVVHDLDHHLLGLHGGEYARADGLVLHLVAEVLGYLVAYVGVQEGFADVLDGFRHVNLGDFSFTFQYLERPL